MKLDVVSRGLAGEIVLDAGGGWYVIRTRDGSTPAGPGRLSRFDLKQSLGTMIATVNEELFVAQVRMGAWDGRPRTADEGPINDVVLAHPGHPDQKIHGGKSGMHEATAGERKALVIPPAWTNVHVSDSPEGVNGLVAIGYDTKGRSQYRYTAAHTEAQAAKKFARVKALSPHLDGLDRSLDEHSLTNDDAGAVLLIRRLGLRPGSTTDTGAKVQAYGATTLLARHATIEGDAVRLQFVGKKGVAIDITTRDPVVHAAVSARLRSRSGDQPLFNTNADKAAGFMHQTAPGFKLKDLRTVRANVVAIDAIRSRPAPTSKAELEVARRGVAKVVSAQLGNTPAVALDSYINPTVFAPWEAAIAA